MREDGGCKTRTSRLQSPISGCSLSLVHQHPLQRPGATLDPRKSQSQRREHAPELGLSRAYR
jgi:hypothetical protein